MLIKWAPLHDEYEQGKDSKRSLGCHADSGSLINQRLDHEKLGPKTTTLGEQVCLCGWADVHINSVPSHPYDCCAACICAKSRSVSGLFKIFSSLNRFRADIGGQFRINTASFNRRTSCSSCVRIFLLRSMRFPVNLWMTWRETVTVAVLRMQPALVTIPVNAMGGMVGKYNEFWVCDVAVWTLYNVGNIRWKR